MIHGAALDLFGRHVTDGAHDFARISINTTRRNTRLREIGVAGARKLGQTKVENLDATIVCDEQIVRLEIAMDYALLMRGRQAMSDLKRVIDRFSLRQGCAADSLSQRFEPSCVPMS